MCNLLPPTHPFAKRTAYYSHFIARSFENSYWLIRDRTTITFTILEVKTDSSRECFSLGIASYTPAEKPSRSEPFFLSIIVKVIIVRSLTADWVWSNDGVSSCPGHTVIYNPEGEELARSHEAKEQFLSFEISRSSLNREKGRRVLGSPFLSNHKLF
jgi:hypothetical protein